MSLRELVYDLPLSRQYRLVLQPVLERRLVMSQSDQEHSPRKIDWATESFNDARPGIHGATFHTPQLTATLYRYDAGSEWEEHHHPEDQVTTVLSGEIEFVVDGRPVLLTAGQSALLPGGAKHSATVGRSPVTTINVFTRRPAPPQAPSESPRST